MVLEISLPVGVVNALIFFVLDLPALWAIHGGLLALQGYYLYSLARSRKSISISRSRIHIFGGEFLESVSRWPSFFLYVHTLVLLILFLSTIGVDASQRKIWIPTAYKNLTTLSVTRDISTYKNHFLSFFRDQAENVTCATQNSTHKFYWIVVFDAPWNLCTLNNANCQAEAPGYSPLYHLECYPRVE